MSGTLDLMRILFSAIAISCIFIFALPSTTEAYCGVPELRPSGEYYQSDVIFTGRVISASYGPAGGFYRLTVTRRFKGTIGSVVAVHTYSDDNRFPLQKGRSYLLFAYEINGRLEINSCGNSALVSEASESIRIVEKLPEAPNYGVIEGWVVPETDGIDVSGVKVTVSGPSQNYTAVTDKKGWFHFRAPIGRYRLNLIPESYYLNGGDSFRYDPNSFTLHPGETASLQVVSTRHRSR